MPRPPEGLMRLQHAAIKVHDIEAAKDFYVNTLGFTISEIYPPGTVGDFPFGLCFMRCTELHHDMNLIFWPDGEGPAPPEGRSFDTLQTGLHHIAFQVEGRTQLENWASYLEEKEVEIFWGPSIHSPTHPEGDGFWGEKPRALYCGPIGQLHRNFLRPGRHGPLHEPGERRMVPGSALPGRPRPHRSRSPGSLEALNRRAKSSISSPMG